MSEHPLFLNLKPQSAMALAMAMKALETPNVAGLLLIRIDPRPNHPTECSFSTGADAYLVSDWRNKR